MTQVATIGAFWQSASRRWRAVLRRLRHNATALGLALLLSMWLSEPLLCIFHCQIWLPSALQSYFATQHQHHHNHGQSTPGAAPGSTAEPGSALLCLSAAGDGGPLYVPPTPIHDLALLLALATFMPLLFIASLPIAPASKPPQIPPLRRLRPPIGWV